MKLNAKRWSILATGALALSMVGAPTFAATPSADDPVATVNTLLDTLAAKDFAGIADLVCSQYAAEVATRFDLATQFASLGDGVDAQAFIDGLTLTIDPREVTLASNDGAAAVVDVVAQMSIGVDEEAAKVFVAQVLAMQGIEASPAMVDAVMPQLLEQFSEPTDLSEAVDVVLENGAWLVCEPFGESDGTSPSASPAG